MSEDVQQQQQVVDDLLGNGASDNAPEAPQNAPESAQEPQEPQPQGEGQEPPKDEGAPEEPQPKDEGEPQPEPEPEDKSQEPEQKKDDLSDLEDLWRRFKELGKKDDDSQRPQTPSEQVQQQQQPEEPSRENALEALRNDMRHKLRDYLGEDADYLSERVLDGLAKALADLQLASTEQALRTMMQSVPQLFQQHLQQMQLQQRFAEAFYSRWPQLRGHEDVVQRIAQVYFNAVGDQVDPRTAIEEIGAAAIARLGLPIYNRREDASERRQVPPAKPGATGNQATQPRNIFEQMFEEDLNEDLT